MLRVIAAPAAEPVTLADAKLFLRVDGSADDALIGALISAAREYAEHYTQSSLSATGYELALSDFPVDAILLPYSPVASVDSIKYTDSSGQELTIDPNAYVLAGYGMTAAIYPIQPWPGVGTAYPNPVRVRYTSSAASIPPAARAAIMELIAHLYETREDSAGIPGGVTRLLDVVKVY